MQQPVFILLCAIGLTLLGCGLVHLVMRHQFMTRLGKVNQDLAKSRQARQYAAEQHAQMRRQIDILSAELDAARKARLVMPARQRQNVTRLQADKGMFIINGSSSSAPAHL